MITTEKRHWVNGHQIRGGWFHTLTASIGNLAVMISWGRECTKKLQIGFYRLTGPSLREIERRRRLGIPYNVIEDPNYLENNNYKT